jgi:transposase
VQDGGSIGDPWPADRVDPAKPARQLTWGDFRRHLWGVSSRRLQLLRGEDLETVSRALGVTAATLTAWRDAFLAAGEASLASRPADGEALEGERLKARLGEMLLERELLEAKIAALEARGPVPLARRRSRP